jgi:hypothetical protein
MRVRGARSPRDGDPPHSPPRWLRDSDSIQTDLLTPSNIPAPPLHAFEKGNPTGRGDLVRRDSRKMVTPSCSGVEPPAQNDHLALHLRAPPRITSVGSVLLHRPAAPRDHRGRGDRTKRLSKDRFHAETVAGNLPGNPGTVPYPRAVRPGPAVAIGRRTPRHPDRSTPRDSSLNVTARIGFRKRGPRLSHEMARTVTAPWPHHRRGLTRATRT